MSLIHRFPQPQIPSPVMPVRPQTPEVSAWIERGGIAQIDPDDAENVPDWLKRSRARMASGEVQPCTSGGITYDAHRHAKIVDYRDKRRPSGRRPQA